LAQRVCAPVPLTHPHPLLRPAPPADSLLAKLLDVPQRGQFRWWENNSNEMVWDMLQDFYFYGYSFCKEQRFSPAKISTFMSIVKQTLDSDIENNSPTDTIDASFKKFSALLDDHCIDRPPNAVAIFSTADGQRVLEYVTHSYFRHWNLYKYACTKHQNTTFVQTVGWDMEPIIQPRSLNDLATPVTLPPAPPQPEASTSGALGELSSFGRDFSNDGSSGSRDAKGAPPGGLGKENSHASSAPFLDMEGSRASLMGAYEETANQSPRLGDGDGGEGEPGDSALRRHAGGRGLPVKQEVCWQWKWRCHRGDVWACHSKATSDRVEEAYQKGEKETWVSVDDDCDWRHIDFQESVQVNEPPPDTRAEEEGRAQVPATGIHHELRRCVGCPHFAVDKDKHRSAGTSSDCARIAWECASDANAAADMAQQAADEAGRHRATESAKLKLWLHLQAAKKRVEEDIMRAIQRRVLQMIDTDAPSIRVDLIHGVIELKESIQFEGGCAVIKEESQPLMGQVGLVGRCIEKTCAEFMRASLHLRIEGHVHPNPKQIARGNKTSNERAQCVVDSMLAHGCDQQYLHPQGFGGSRPLGAADLNRRVEIHVMTRADIEKVKAQLAALEAQLNGEADF
jgi:flagellar motor protein MotB